MNYLKKIVGLCTRFCNSLKYSDIIGRGKILAEKGADIQYSKNSVFSVGGSLIVRAGTLLATRESGKLIFKGQAFINRNCYIVSYNKIEFGSCVTIGPSTCIVDHNHDIKTGHGVVTAPICIGDNVWIGSNCSILMGTTIGRNSVIASGSVITKDVPADTIVIQKRVTSYKNRD